MRYRIGIVFPPLLLYCLSSSGESPPDISTVLIEAGTMTMGTPIEDKDDPLFHEDEAPPVEIEVASFKIAKYPVTAQEMCVFLNAAWVKQRYDLIDLYNHQPIGSYEYSTIVLDEDGVYRPREGAEDVPANQVTWMGAVAFCEWLSEVSGRLYRLPTEAEWEFAARGPEGRTWPWGESSPGKEHGIRYDYAAIGEFRPVGSHPANATPQGVHDMLAYIIGEWCTNKYTSRLLPKEVNDKVVDTADLESDRVVRGYYHRLENRKRTNFFSWFFLPEVGHHLGQTWTRVGSHPIDAVKQAARHGFRVVEELPIEEQAE